MFLFVVGVALGAAGTYFYLTEEVEEGPVDPRSEDYQN
jgi:uncharacterized membrane protein YczE